MWNPESTDMESGIHSVESGIQDSPGLPYMGRDFEIFRLVCTIWSFRKTWSEGLSCIFVVSTLPAFVVDGSKSFWSHPKQFPGLFFDSVCFFDYSRDPFLESPETFRANFGWHNSLCIFKTTASWGTKFYIYVNFPPIYYILQGQLYRISGSEWRYEWLFGTFEKGALGSMALVHLKQDLNSKLKFFSTCWRNSPQ